MSNPARAIALKLRKAQIAWRNYRRRSRDTGSARGPQNTRELDLRLDRVRAAWLDLMGDFQTELGVVELPPDPVLTERHLANCRVLPHREALLQQMKAGGIAAEVGVQAGEFSRSILDLCRPARLHLIDLDLQRFRIRERFAPEIAAGVVQLHEGDSSRIVRRFPDQSFDLIYIDADHSYYGVKRDIEAARAKVEPDGFLVFNDYTYWSPAECMRYGVTRAVNELCLEDDWEMVFFAFGPLMYCDVALRRLTTRPVPRQ